MNLRDALPRDLARNYGKLAAEHVLRGCGDFSRGPDSCACTCADHPCWQPLESEKRECSTCQGAGFLRSRMTYDAQGRLNSSTVKCPDCSIGLEYLAPTLLWRSPTDFRLDRVPEPERDAIAGWVYQRAEPFLVLVGPLGAGKTFAAVSAGRALAQLGLTVEFYSSLALLDDLRKTIARDDRDADSVLYHALNDRVFILDDLGAEQQTDWAAARLLRVIDERYAALLPSLVTTNDLREPSEDRLWSRLRDVNVSRIVVMRSRNWRQEKSDG